MLIRPCITETMLLWFFFQTFISSFCFLNFMSKNPKDWGGIENHYFNVLHLLVISFPFVIRLSFYLFQMVRSFFVNPE